MFFQKRVIMFMGLLFTFSSLSSANASVGNQTLSLDGEWKFTTDQQGVYTVQTVASQGSWRTAKVPGSWQSQFEDLRDYQGVAWYRKKVDLSIPDSGKSAWLHFNAVDYRAEVFLNGNSLGSHEGGYTPFDFDITRFIKKGANELIIRVMDPKLDKDGTEGIKYAQIPHGKQSWYVQTSGLWQSVSIRYRPAWHIRRVYVTPTTDGKVRLNLLTSLITSKKQRSQVQIEVLGPDMKTAAKVSKKIWDEVQNYTFELQVSAPRLWDIDKPELYTVEVILGEEKVTEKFGFRSFEKKDGKFYLNGRPVYIMGALDQDFYPETIYSTPSEEYLRDEMRKARELGLNMLRCHIKVPDPVYLRIADETGLLVWYEIPNWDHFTTESAARGQQTVNEMLDRDWNHPSLVIISIINESWGIDLSQPAQREWLKNEYNRLKGIASGRLIIDNSACYNNYHVKTDINDYHIYYAIPENKDKFSAGVKDIASRPAWLFSTHGDAEQKGDEPLMLSEFGNWGLPQLPDQLPWWFVKDTLRREPTTPGGFDRRFRQYGYDAVFGSYNALAQECQAAQFEALKWEIEEIRLHQTLQGYIITEFTDLNWESNGLLDMWRNKKNYADALSDIQQQDIIIPRPKRFTFWQGDSLKIDLWLSHYSHAATPGSQLEWQGQDGQSGKISVPEIKSPVVSQLPSVSLKLPAMDKPGNYRVHLKWVDAGKQILAQNYCDVFVFTPVKPESPAVIRIHDPRAKLKSMQEFLAQNYQEKSKKQTASELWITDTLDAQIINLVKDGAHVLLLTNAATKLPESFPLKIQVRDRDYYDGNWASNFNWLQPGHTLFTDLQPERHFGFMLAHSVPRHVYTGLEPDHFRDVLAGMFVGWLHLNSGYLVQLNHGEGKLVLCSLPLSEMISSDPFAAWMLDRLIRYMSGKSIKPLLEWK